MSVLVIQAFPRISEIVDCKQSRSLMRRLVMSYSCIRLSANGVKRVIFGTRYDRCKRLVFVVMFSVPHFAAEGRFTLF